MAYLVMVDWRLIRSILLEHRGASHWARHRTALRQRDRPLARLWNGATASCSPCTAVVGMLDMLLSSR